MGAIFSNPRETMHVANTLNGLTLNGEFQFNKTENLIVNFSGIVFKDNVSANFNYSEESNGNVSSSINSVPSIDKSTAMTLIDNTIESIHSELNTVQGE